MDWPTTDKFITWALVLLGWAVVNELQDFREMRKERLVRVTELRRKLDDFEKTVLAFHTSEFSGNENLIIQATLGSIARELKLLHDCRYIELQYENCLITFRVACTQVNFDKTSHQALSYDNLVCLSIMQAKGELDRTLLAAQFDATNTTPSIFGVFGHMFSKAVRNIRRSGHAIADWWNR